jgi:hypothetical protein
MRRVFHFSSSYYVARNSPTRIHDRDENRRLSTSGYQLRADHLYLRFSFGSPLLVFYTLCSGHYNHTANIIWYAQSSSHFRLSAAQPRLFAQSTSKELIPPCSGWIFRIPMTYTPFNVLHQDQTINTDTTTHSRPSGETSAHPTCNNQTMGPKDRDPGSKRRCTGRLAWYCRGRAVGRANVHTNDGGHLVVSKQQAGVGEETAEK